MGIQTSLSRAQNRFCAIIPNAYLNIKNFSVNNDRINVEVALFFDKEARDTQTNNGEHMPHETGNVIQTFNFSFNEDDLPEKSPNMVTNNASDLLKSCIYEWIKINKYQSSTDVFETGQFVQNAS